MRTPYERLLYCKSGRPGPVLVDVTKDVTGALYDYSPRRPATVNRETSEIHRENGTGSKKHDLQGAETVYFCWRRFCDFRRIGRNRRSFLTGFRLRSATALWGKADSQEKIHIIRECWECMEQKPPIWESVSAIF